MFSGGNVELAASGSGVPAGLITGLLAGGVGPVEPAFWGVFLHGEAGARLAIRRGTPGFLS